MLQIINTGVANIRSLQATFDRLEQPWKLTDSAEEIAQSELVVLPGVGAFAAAMTQLNQLGIREAIISRIQENRPTLAICLGFQLLCKTSEESPGVEGLGILDRHIRRFTGPRFSNNQLKVPQLGWNDVTPTSEGLVTPGVAYFANSFHLDEKPEQPWSCATTQYGHEFVSAMWRGNILACQFHPELSGDWGESILKNWIELGSQTLEQGATC